MENEMQFTARITRWRDRGVVPLKETLRIGERAVLFGMCCGGGEEYFCLYVFRTNLSPPDLRSVTPEVCSLGDGEVTYDQPVQGAHTFAMQRTVHRADCGVLAHDEIALHLPVGHRGNGCHVGMVSRQTREVIETPSVGFGCSVGEPRLQQRHDVFRKLRPPPSGAAIARKVFLEGVVHLIF